MTKDSLPLKGIDIELAQRLITNQFPDFKDLEIHPVKKGGWDNRTFLLGPDMLIRLPSAAEYAGQVEKEQRWLPWLASRLSFSIPEPVAMGHPDQGYPWKWSVYRWIKGETAASTPDMDHQEFAVSLAGFLNELHAIAPENGPRPGNDNFYRGGSLRHYDTQTRQAILSLQGRIDAEAATRVWEMALASKWNQKPAWLHGDVSLGNLLMRDGKLHAVIDWGMMAVGDPACDLAIAWTLFEGKSRTIFREKVASDNGTWLRGRAWALWKSLIIAAGFCHTNATEGSQAWHIIDKILQDAASSDTVANAPN